MADKARNKKLKTDKFKFISYQPGDSQNLQTRRQVWSHVTRWRHQNVRKRLRKGDLISGDGSTSATASSPREATAEPKSVVATQNTTHEPGSESNVDGLFVPPPAREATVSERAWSRLVGNTLAKPFSQGTMSFRTIALRDPENIVGRSINELQLELPSIMRLYRKICERQSQNFISHYGQGSGRFYPLIFTDPVLLSSAVLIGARNQLEVQGRSIEGKSKIGVINLEQFITRSINDALLDPFRCVTDQMLLAVGLCAAYEIKHGTEASYHMHMRGLVQMINMRGGLLALGDPDPYVLRVLFWLDINTSHLANCKPYFEAMADSHEVHVIADPKVFQYKGSTNT